MLSAVMMFSLCDVVTLLKVIFLRLFKYQSVGFKRFSIVIHWPTRICIMISSICVLNIDLLN